MKLSEAISNYSGPESDTLTILPPEFLESEADQFTHDWLMINYSLVKDTAQKGYEREQGEIKKDPKHIPFYSRNHIEMNHAYRMSVAFRIGMESIADVLSKAAAEQVDQAA